MKEKRFKAQRCNRCNHKWLSRAEGRPTVCPRCKSVYWNSPRKLHYDWHATHRRLVRV